MFTIVKATNNEKIFSVIERTLMNRKINAIHAEAKNYAFRTSGGKWHTAQINFVNELSGFGSNNFKNMLDDVHNQWTFNDNEQLIKMNKMKEKIFFSLIAFGILSISTIFALLMHNLI